MTKSHWPNSPTIIIVICKYSLYFQSHVPPLALEVRAIDRDSIYTVAYKMLPNLTSVNFLAPHFKLAKISHMVGKILEGQVPMPSLDVAQTIMASSMVENVTKLQIKLAAKAIVPFDKGV